MVKLTHLYVLILCSKKQATKLMVVT